LYQEAKQWDDALRESARIRESQGDLAFIAGTWNKLVQVTEGARKPEVAEAWYRKAIKAGKASTVQNF